MRKKRIVITVSVALLFLVFIASCIYITISKIKNDKEHNINIYSVDRDEFIAFLDGSATNLLKSKLSNDFSLSNGVIKYIRQNSSLFVVDKSFLSFVSDIHNLEKYLLTQNIDEKIQDVVLFDTPNVPISLWIKTINGEYFITIDEEPADEIHTYRLYTFSEFKKIFGRIEAKVIVNERIVDFPTKVFMYNDYADIPLCELLEALGAEITHNNEKVIISVNGEKYILTPQNIELTPIDEPDQNLLYQLDGGVSFINNVNGILVIDTITLNVVLMDMGIKVDFLFDKTNGNILISNQSYSVI